MKMEFKMIFLNAATLEKMKFSIKDFFTFTEEIVNGKLHFFVQCLFSLKILGAQVLWVKILQNLKIIIYTHNFNTFLWLIETELLTKVLYNSLLLYVNRRHFSWNCWFYWILSIYDPSQLRYKTQNHVMFEKILQFESDCWQIKYP